jgi:hypothetical protein
VSKKLKLGDCSHARHHVLLGSSAKKKIACMDISVPMVRVPSLGKAAVSPGRCIMLIRLEISGRPFRRFVRF